MGTRSWIDSCIMDCKLHNGICCHLISVRCTNRMFDATLFTVELLHNKGIVATHVAQIWMFVATPLVELMLPLMLHEQVCLLPLLLFFWICRWRSVFGAACCFTVLPHTQCCWVLYTVAEEGLESMPLRRLHYHVQGQIKGYALDGQYMDVL